MAEQEFYDLFGNSDSEDDEFLGFTLADINYDEAFDVHDNVDIEEDELLEDVLREIDQEERDPKHDAYDCQWLRNFAMQSGPRHVDEDASESDIFQHIFDDDIISLFVEETNKYYKQYIEKVGGIDNLKPHARARKWVDVDNAEMKAFFAIVLYMGLVRLPNYESYWSNDILLSLPVKSVMIRDRFLNILTFLHCADNNTEPPRDSPMYDPIYKFSKLSKLLIANWQKYYYPKRELAVDETLIPFKGRTKFLQYIPSKPHKWGIKVWTLAESSSGYVYNWMMYTGKVINVGNPRNQKGVAHSVVWDISTPIQHNGHHIYCDNFFTSPALFQDLSEVETGACGTLRTNRAGVPREVKLAKPNKGDPPVVHKDGKNVYISWCDKRLVNILTTVHNGSCFTKTVRSRFHNNHTREVDHPRAIQLYTQYMGGVDSADQQTQYCVSQHRVLKWWKKVVLCNLLEVSFCNAKIIWKHFHPTKKLSSTKFRLTVIHSLLQGYEHPNRKFARPCSAPSRRLTEKHFPALNPKMTPAGRRSSCDCEVCSNREEKCRHQTQYICKTCDVPLCIYPCFERYHTLLDYKVVCNPTLHK